MTDVELDGREEDDQALIEALTDLAPVLHLARWPTDTAAWSHRLLCDPTFAAEMRVCERYRMPHSALLGWSDEDRAKALAFHLHEAQRCQSCGVHPLEWPAEADPPPFDATMSECQACAELARFQRHVQENNPKGKDNPLMDGLKPTLRRRGF